jgi:hypothetical protein
MRYPAGKSVICGESNEKGAGEKGADFSLCGRDLLMFAVVIVMQWSVADCPWWFICI